MLQNIPTHVIAGPLGAGKTSLIRQLLAQRPAGERWAVLINEFGQIGLDAALLSRDDDGIALGEVAGGCLCCVNGMPFQVGLGRLLRKARPDRLLIEPSGLGHPAQLLAQLRKPPWTGVLNVQALIMVLDAASLAAGQPLPEAQQQALAVGGLLIMNKSGAVDDQKRLLITSQLPDLKRMWTDHGFIPVDCLTSVLPAPDTSIPVGNTVIPSAETSLPALWVNPRTPICLSQEGAGGWSVGWRWHPAQRFDLERLQGFLKQWEWRRAKVVIHSGQGWCSFNGLAGQSAEWGASEWRKDSRIELIFDQPQPLEPLKQALEACCVEG